MFVAIEQFKWNTSILFFITESQPREMEQQKSISKLECMKVTLMIESLIALVAACPTAVVIQLR
jgi:ABC-type phosphate transport system permease subunit